jgi:hypothetical protein
MCSCSPGEARFDPPFVPRSHSHRKAIIVGASRDSTSTQSFDGRSPCLDDDSVVPTGACIRNARQVRERPADLPKLCPHLNMGTTAMGDCRGELADVALNPGTLGSPGRRHNTERSRSRTSARPAMLRR